MASSPASAPSGRGTRLARALGWFSLVLGVSQVAAPRRVNDLVGVADSAGARALMRALGVRELGAAAGILSRPRAAFLLWARVTADVMDLLLLARALRAAGEDRRGRLTAAAAAVAGVSVLDIVAGVRLGRASERTGKGGAVRAKAAITVNRPRDEVYRYWRDFENLPNFMYHLESVQTGIDGGRSHWVARAPAGKTVEWDAEVVEDRPGELIAWRSVGAPRVENSGSVRFASAYGGRGTEVTVELEYVPPGRAVGAVVAKLFGEEPAQQSRDDLRRFKQVIETGEVLRSDGSPDGSRTQRQLRQRAAQPRRAKGKRQR